MSHCREPARALGSEYGLDADALTVCSSLQFAYCWAGRAPDVVSCVQQSPTKAGPAVGCATPAGPACGGAPHPPPYQPYQPHSRAIDLTKFCHSPGNLASCLCLRRSTRASACACRRRGEGGEGWAGLGWAGLDCGAAPAVSFKRSRRGPRTIRIVSLLFSPALASQTDEGSPV